MCVPTVFIREDGKGFIVRAGGIDFDVHCPDPLDPDFWRAINKEGVVVGYGSTIMSAVENTLAKVRAAESVDASIQEGKRER